MYSMMTKGMSKVRKRMSSSRILLSSELCMGRRCLVTQILAIAVRDIAKTRVIPKTWITLTKCRHDHIVGPLNKLIVLKATTANNTHDNTIKPGDRFTIPYPKQKISSKVRRTVAHMATMNRHLERVNVKASPLLCDIS